MSIYPRMCSPAPRTHTHAPFQEMSSVWVTRLILELFKSQSEYSLAQVAVFVLIILSNVACFKDLLNECHMFFW